MSKTIAGLQVQAGPVVRLDLPPEASGGHRGFAFCQYVDVVRLGTFLQLNSIMLCSCVSWSCRGCDAISHSRSMHLLTLGNPDVRSKVIWSSLAGKCEVCSAIVQWACDAARQARASPFLARGETPS